MSTLYENIKTRRKELKLTQTDLAEKMGYSHKSVISKIEKGEINLPQSRIIDFANALDTTPEQLMGWSRSKEEIKTEVEILATIAKDKELLKLLGDYYKLPDDKRKYIRDMLSMSLTNLVNFG